MSILSRLAALLSAAVLAVSVVPDVRADVSRSLQDGAWVLQNQALRVTVDPQAGRVKVEDKAAGHVWRQAAGGALGDTQRPRFREARELPQPGQGITFIADFGTTGPKPNTLTVSLTLPDAAADLCFEVDMADRMVEFGEAPFLDPFPLDSPTAVFAVADYCNGHLYPVNPQELPRRSFSGSRLDMPWVGLCDLEKGYGYAMILETPDDASVRLPTVRVDGRELAAPQVVWTGAKKQFAYPRRLICHFSARGGYVALAKRYRAYARAQGLIVPLAEKLKRNPKIERLFGAPDVWGDASLQFAQETKAAGVEKMIIHGRSKPAEMKEINKLGYLTSEYDNYTDILPLAPGKGIDAHHDRLPDSAVLKADGERMKAWLTFDKKTQYMKRCPALWVPAAQAVVPKALAESPFLGRFIDVTTAEDLYECYDPQHPLARRDKRQCGVDLLRCVRSQGLVVGGEHGVWWAVPQVDYIEGMMSSSYYSWPAGHLIRPKSKDQEFTSPWGGKLGKWESYARWGIGHEHRAPLWELVFHDCVVSTWYWGDSSDFLLAAAPEITPKKDAFNVLYGTIPIMWASREGSWPNHKDVFLRTYRNTCKLHEVIAGKEMLSHEFLTPDRAVQRTRFADGAEVIVNFGAQPYEAKLSGAIYRLPQNGFAVKGPQIEQSLTLVDGQPVTTIRAGGYRYTDRKESTNQSGRR